MPACEIGMIIALHVSPHKNKTLWDYYIQAIYITLTGDNKCIKLIEFFSKAF